MPEPLAYLNGRQLPAAQLSVPVWDTGFVQGVTVAEQLRTFAGRLFRLEQHLDRLSDSLAVVGIQLPFSSAELMDQASALVAHNYRLLAPGDDLGLSMFITPGPYAGLAPPGSDGPLVAMHTYPVAFSLFADKYLRGERLATTDVEQVPAACWPLSLKCRSRMHYYLADRQARTIDPQARALLRDQAGFVTEASTANLLLYRDDEGLVSPPRAKILPGVSIAAAEELACQMNIPFAFREVTVDDVQQSQEVFLCSTSPCLLPVVALNNQSIGNGRPGAMFARLIQAWSEQVGLDIVGQARQFSSRR